MHIPPWISFFLLISTTPFLVLSNPLTDADQLLASGNALDALPLYTAAMNDDPTNPSIRYKRAAAYLTLRRYRPALEDLDGVLEGEHGGFARARLERARTRAKLGMLSGAVEDLEVWMNDAGDAASEDEKGLLPSYKEAEEAMKKVEEATEKKDWKTVAEASGKVLVVANSDPGLRLRRAKALLELAIAEGDMEAQRGWIEEAAGEYSRAASLDPSATETHHHAALLLYLPLRRYEAAIAMLKACLKTDPEHKGCKKEFKRIKKLEKVLEGIEEDRQGKKWTGVTKKVTGGATGEDEAGGWGDARAMRKEVEQLLGFPENRLKVRWVEAQLATWACLAYGELKLIEKTLKWCKEATDVLPATDSYKLDCLITMGDAYLLKEDLDAALSQFQKANEINSSDGRVQERLARTQRLVRAQASRRDYYKILDVPKDASQKDIKKAWRKLAHQWHPDKYKGTLSKEKVAEKMSEINLAYEILGNEEKRQQYDSGHDPNDPMQQGGGGGGGQPFFFTQEGGPFQHFFQGFGGGHGHQHFGGGFEFKF